MPRVKKNVDVSLLKRVVKEVEGTENFSNLSQLYETVTNRYNSILRDIKMGANTNGKMVGDIFPEITASVVMLRIKENNIKIKTVAGPRGRPKGTIVRSDGKPIKKTSRAEKFQNNPAMMKSLEALKKELKNKPSWYAKIESGSLAAAVKAYCYFCSGESTIESRHCELIGCSLHLFLNRKTYE